jgi:hypothetical protein
MEGLDAPGLLRIEKAKVYSPFVSPRSLHLETPVATRQQPIEGVFLSTQGVFALDLYLGSLHARDLDSFKACTDFWQQSDPPLPDPLFDPCKSTSKPRP